MNKRILRKMPDTKMPVISVVIPTYNRAGSLRDAIKSAMAQDFRDIEIIVIDDASTDNTPELLAAMAAKSPNLRVLRHEANKGAAAARNTGIRAAQGQYVALLDSDDLWVVDKLTRQLAYLKEKGGPLCVCNTVYRKHDSEELAPRPLPELDGDDYWSTELVQGLGVNAGSALLAEKTIFDRIGLFDENMPRLEDWDWFIRFVLDGGIFDNAPFNGAIIQVGGSPSVAAVAQSVEILRQKHSKVVYDQMGAGMSDRFQAALKLEVAATKLWQRDFIGFTKGWFEAAVCHPPLAAHFIFTRIKRVINGDAPRFFQLFKK